MKELHLEVNKFNGTLDTLQLENMKELQSLSLAYNDMSGTIPATIGFANKLRYLKLKENRFSGTLPSSIANLTELETFHVSYNHLSGSLPEQFFEMKQLVNVSLSHNLFSGTVSPKLSQLSHLEELHLTGNSFTGALPDVFRPMRGLVNLHVGENQFTGQVPKSLGSTPLLETLDLTSNQFVGSMPLEICELRETGKLSQLSADCAEGDSSGMDLSALFGFNGRRDLQVGQGRLGGSFEEEAPEGEENVEEEVIDAGDFVYLEEDGTVEDMDGNIIEGVEVQDLQVAEDQMSGVNDLPDGHMYAESAPIRERSSMNQQAPLVQNEEHEDENIGDIEDIHITQPIVLQDDDDDIASNRTIAYAKRGDLGGNEEEAFKVNRTSAVYHGDKNEDDDNDAVEAIPKPVSRVPIAYGANEAQTTTASKRFECQCCTYCASTPFIQGAMRVEMPQNQEQLPEVKEPAKPVAKVAHTAADEKPGVFSKGIVGSSDCAEALQTGNTSDEYPGLVGMNAKDAKQCLESYTDRSVVLVRGSGRTQHPFEANRIIIHVDNQGKVASMPIVG